MFHTLGSRENQRSQAWLRRTTTAQSPPTVCRSYIVQQTLEMPRKLSGLWWALQCTAPSPFRKRGAVPATESAVSRRPSAVNLFRDCFSCRSASSLTEKYLDGKISRTGDGMLGWEKGCSIKGFLDFRFGHKASDTLTMTDHKRRCRLNKRHKDDECDEFIQGMLRGRCLWEIQMGLCGQQLQGEGRSRNHSQDGPRDPWL